MCREEAVQLSKLEPTLSKLNVPLIAVLHEELGHEEFQAFFKGPLFYDHTKCFFGPVERRLFMLGFLRIQTYANIFQAKPKGNLEGDGTLLGGVFVIGPGESGVVFEHREKYWGDYVDTSDVIKAVEAMPKSN